MVFALFKRQIIAINDKALLALANVVNDVRQVVQVILVHLDHAQAPGCKLVQQGLDDGRLASAATAPQQHMVTGLARQKAFGVLDDFLFLGIDTKQVIQAHRVRLGYRSQSAGTATPDGGGQGAPVDGLGRAHGNLSAGKIRKG